MYMPQHKLDLLISKQDLQNIVQVWFIFVMALYTLELGLLMLQYCLVLEKYGFLWEGTIACSLVKVRCALRERKSLTVGLAWFTTAWSGLSWGLSES